MKPALSNKNLAIKTLLQEYLVQFLELYRQLDNFKKYSAI